MEIPNGITGFYMAGEVQPPQVDEKQFKRVCFELAVSNNGKDIQFNTPEYPINFYSVRVEIFEKQFYILLNIIHILLLLRMLVMETLHLLICQFSMSSLFPNIQS